MTCFLAALAMGPISPLLPLAGLAYFMLMWTFWRYTVRSPPDRAEMSPGEVAQHCITPDANVLQS